MKSNISTDVARPAEVKPFSSNHVMNLVFLCYCFVLCTISLYTLYHYYCQLRRNKLCLALSRLLLRDEDVGQDNGLLLWRQAWSVSNVPTVFFSGNVCELYIFGRFYVHRKNDKIDDVPLVSDLFTTASRKQMKKWKFVRVNCVTSREI